MKRIKKRMTVEELLDPGFRLQMIPQTFQKHGLTFSKAVAAKLVGGKAKLYWLIEQGKIRMEKPTEKRNGKWYCDAGDVINHIRF